VKPELVVLSLANAEAYDPAGVEICISIVDPESAAPQLSPKFAAVLPLRFTDITKPGTAEFDILFDATHAAAILDFITAWPTAERIVVHCMAGVSRSAGVALGLCDIHGWPTDTLETEKPLFNTWVRAELGRCSQHR